MQRKKQKRAQDVSGMNHEGRAQICVKHADLFIGKKLS